MSSNLTNEARALLVKEFRSEIRSPQGFLNAGLFSLSSVIIVSLATNNDRLSPTTAAGLFWVIGVFSIVAALPRGFIAEEEHQTGDLLRLTARPQAVYWGKQLFGLLQALVSVCFLAVLFLVLTNQPVANGALFFSSLIAGAAALSGAVTFCGALASRAANRHALATAIALPQILPVSAWAVAATRAAFGAGSVNGGWLTVLGLLGYAALTLIWGPHLYAAVWKK